MKIKTVFTQPFKDQRPGTSGLRKKVEIFQTPHYLENFIQSVFNSLNIQGKTLIIGGDGRFFMKPAIQKIIKISAANGVKQLIIGQNGLLSTPAVSHIIRKYRAFGGFILSASHNRGGENGDFGIKYNIENGGSAPESLTEIFFEETQKIEKYFYYDVEDINIDQKGRYFLEHMRIDIIDSVQDYADLMESIFDFSLISQAREKGLSFCFDAMHAVTGIYAKEIFVNRLGFAPTDLLHAEPLEDFGGTPPDPSQEHLKKIFSLQMSDQAVDLAAASDGDGDRNLILGKYQVVTPSDSLAVILAHIDLFAYYKDKAIGVARSMPTSCAVDDVAAQKNIPCYETPTGWKFFGNLLDAEKIMLCGEESYGTSSCHIREKDGLWAILFWLQLLAISKKSVKDIIKKHWHDYGRWYYTRHDYSDLDKHKAEEFMLLLKQNLKNFTGKIIENHKITHADSFCYQDPIDKTLTQDQGIRIFLEPKGRIVFRLSGTGTSGAILRIYIESYEKNPSYQQENIQKHLARLILIAQNIGKIESFFNRKEADIIN